MIARFDHGVIAVRDLAEAITRFQRLGFGVSPGGRHTGRGTYNAIIRLGLDYLELLSIYDVNEIGARGLNGASLAEFLQRHEGGLAGYALATVNIGEDARRFATTALEAEGPFAMQRLRPDGHQLSWQLLVPGGTPWRRPWPFLIQWETPDAERLSWEQPGVHPNGAASVAGIALAVHDLEDVIKLYEGPLGLSLAGQDEVPALHARRASFRVGTFRIDLLAPLDAGPVQQMLDLLGEGPFELTLTSADLDQTKLFFAQAGIPLAPAQEPTRTLVLPPPQTFGARLVFQERDAWNEPV